MQTLEYSKMTIPDLVKVHNELAPARGEPPLRDWRKDRLHLVQRVAMLRTRTPVAPLAITSPQPTKAQPRRPVQAKQRPQPIRRAILRALAVVDHYYDPETKEHISKARARRMDKSKLQSVGLLYRDCLARVKRRFPNAHTTSPNLRWNATQARSGVAGFEGFTMPDIRPRR